MAAQMLLSYDPKPEPLLPLYTPKQIAAAHKEQTQRTLEMLKAGPCSTGDFIRAGIARFSARIKELREVGYQIETQKTHEHGAVYRLVGR